jgi:hypothetical protein
MDCITDSACRTCCIKNGYADGTCNGYYWACVCTKAKSPTGKESSSKSHLPPLGWRRMGALNWWVWSVWVWYKAKPFDGFAQSVTKISCSGIKSDRVWVFLASDSFKNTRQIISYLNTTIEPLKICADGELHTAPRSCRAVSAIVVYCQSSWLCSLVHQPMLLHGYYF